MNWATDWNKYTLSHKLFKNQSFLAICGMLSQMKAQGPGWTVCHIVYKPLWQCVVATLVTKLWSSNTLSQTILVWNLVFLPLLLSKILWLIQCSVLWLHNADFDKTNHCRVWLLWNYHILDPPIILVQYNVWTIHVVTGTSYYHPNTFLNWVNFHKWCTLLLSHSIFTDFVLYWINGSAVNTSYKILWFCTLTLSFI